MTDTSVFSDATQAAGTGEPMIQLVGVDKFFGDFFGDIFDDEGVVFFGQAQVVAGFQGCFKTFMQDAGDGITITQRSHFSDDISNIDFHGAHGFTFAAHGANPRPACLHRFIHQAKGDHPDQLSGVEAVDA